MRVTCKHCGGPHPAYDCRKKESTAARMDVHLKSQGSGRKVGEEDSAVASLTTSPLSAGTQALPVDTNAPASASKNRARQPRAETGHNLSETKVASDGGISGRVGGASKFDKKAWMREYMRDHRRGIRRRKPVAND